MREGETRCCVRRKSKDCTELVCGGDAGDTPTPADAGSASPCGEQGQRSCWAGHAALWERREPGGVFLSDTQMPPLKAALFAGRVPSPSSTHPIAGGEGLVGSRWYLPHSITGTWGAQSVDHPPQPIPGSATSSRPCRRHLPQPAGSRFSLTKSRSPHRPAPARTTARLSPGPPQHKVAAAQRPPCTPGTLTPASAPSSVAVGKQAPGRVLGWQRHHCRAFPWAGRGSAEVSVPQDKREDPNTPLFGRRGVARRCCTQPGTSAGVQNFLPIGAASLSEALAEPGWVRWADMAKAADHRTTAGSRGWQSPPRPPDPAGSEDGAGRQRRQEPSSPARRCRGRHRDFPSLAGGSGGLAGCLGFTAPPPTPEGAFLGFVGLIPIPVTPGVAVTPAGAKPAFVV